MSRTFLDIQHEQLSGQVDGKLLRIDSKILQARRNIRRESDAKVSRVRHQQPNPE
jgi:hypothetical protein